MLKWLIPLVVVLSFLPPAPVQASSVDITITAMGYIVGAPTGLTLTYISDYEIGISWVKGDSAENTMIRVRFGESPADRTDGYLVYYGDGNYTTDTAVDLTMAEMPYYRAWSETINGTWEEIGATEEANFMSVTWLFMGLGVIAVGLTIAMFAARQYMLGFPSAIFWAIMGGVFYNQSEATWDIYYLVFFAAMGMTIFAMFAAYGVRKQDLSGPDADKGRFIDEGSPSARGGGGGVAAVAQKPDKSDIFYGLDDLDDEEEATQRTKDLRERARRRRTEGVTRKVNWGGFG